METVKLLCTGPISLLPVIATAALLSRGAYLASRFARARGRSKSQRLKRLRFCRNLIPVLPLLGLMGTVLGLVQTLVYMGESNLGSQDDIGAIIIRFAPALGSTFWGIVGAVICIILFESFIHSLEDDTGA